MITRLTGQIARLDIAGPTVELDVAGVTYEVLVPLFLWPELQAMAPDEDADGAPVRPPLSLYIHYSATANQPVPVLVGFLRRVEREFFRKFVSVEGLGPTKAVRAMNVSVSTIARAIEQEERATLTKMPGIGPRVADKIIASLRGKVVAEAALQDGGIAQPVDLRRLGASRLVADVVDTIASLGFSRPDARRWVEEAQAADPGLATVEGLTLAVLRGRDAG